MLASKLVKLSKLILSGEALQEQNIAIMIECYQQLYNAIILKDNKQLLNCLQNCDIQIGEHSYNISDIHLKNYIDKQFGISPLQYAFKYNNLFAFKKIIELGANINDDKYENKTLITHCAIDPTKIEFAKLLLKFNCKINLQSLIYLAKQHKNKKFLKLIEKLK